MPSSHYSFLEYKPRIPVRDMELSMQISIRPTDKKKTQYAARSRDLVRRQYQEHAGFRRKSETTANPRCSTWRSTASGRARATRSASGIAGISGTSITYADPLIKFDGKQLVQVRLVRIGGEGEIFLDGRRIAYAPVD